MSRDDQQPEESDSRSEAPVGPPGKSVADERLLETLHISPEERATLEAQYPSKLGTVGDYVLERELGRGGQGSVFQARDRRLQRTVALKLLGASSQASEQTRKRFQREAEAASKLDHPGICTVYEFGEYEGQPFIAMQLVPGMPLDRCLSWCTGLDPSARSLATPLDALQHESTAVTAPSTPSHSGRGVDEVLRLIETVARALHVAHQAGLVHRDIKPGNIMIRPDREPVILDFGLVQATDSEELALTRTGDRLGTPAYMSPEQIKFDTNLLDLRTDVYSVGVLLYECLTLQRPFDAPTREGLYRSILTEDPPDPRRINPRISADLRAVVDTALDKSRQRRYQNLEALADDLAAVRAGHPVSVKAISNTGRLWRWARRKPALASLLSVLLIGLPILVGLATSIVARQPLVERAILEAEYRASEEHLVTGFLALAEQKYNVALAAFEQARVDGALVPEALAGSAIAFARSGNFEAGLELFSREQATVESIGGLRALRTFLERRAEGQPEHLAGASELDPEHVVDYFVLALRDKDRALAGDAVAAEAAVAAMVQALLRSPPRPVLFFELAQLCTAVQDQDTVKALAETMTSLWPDNGVAFYWAAHSLRLCSEPLLAREYALRGLEVAPNSARLHTQLAHLLSEQGQPDAAKLELNLAMEADPLDAQPHYLMGLILWGEGELDAALLALDEALEREPDHDDAQLTMAQLLLELGLTEEADTLFRGAIQSDPTYTPYRKHYVLFLASEGRFEDITAQAIEFAEIDRPAVWEMADLARDLRMLVTAAMLYRGLTDDQISWDRVAPVRRLQAARSALTAGLGEGDERDLLGENRAEEIVQWARGWLESALPEPASGPLTGEMRAELASWLPLLKQASWNEMAEGVAHLLGD